MTIRAPPNAITNMRVPRLKRCGHRNAGLEAAGTLCVGVLSTSQWLIIWRIRSYPQRSSPPARFSCHSFQRDRRRLATTDRERERGLLVATNTPEMLAPVEKALDHTTLLVEVFLVGEDLFARCVR